MHFSHSDRGAGRRGCRPGRHMDDAMVDRGFDPRSFDPRSFDPRSFDPRSFDPRNADPRGFGHRGGRGHGRFFGTGGFGPEGFGRGFGGGRAGGRGGPFGEDGFGDGPFGGGRGGRGGGRRRLFGNDALKLILLKLIADAPRHGYDLIREIESLSGSVYAPSPGVVYPTLTLLADMDLIAEQPGEGSRKLFAITEAGTAHLAEHEAGVAEVMEKLAHLARKAQRNDAAPVRRALQNMRVAIQHRLEKEGADSQTMFDVAALIDEAASKIERL
ncbi:PadR family transcriptional regulator [Sphingobium sp. MP9-4]|uniref:PadR family transcriptional regulator n=1 Tax=Sphingobium sp. MP9-4 TaxID=1761936 RepID=UPI0010CA7DF2|nr:PadR family transcriptional regulator [Sphingobium sp. MP9-4]TKV40573.1 PadR family transcriptional regulator [Sphingobium sp. MP9-4]